MLRRQLIHRAAISVVAGALPGLTAAARGAVSSWKRGFDQAMVARPWLRAFATVQADTLAGQAQVEGSIPAGLSGTLYRNGPARHEIGDFRYHHWFDGDGMLQAWRISERGVTHAARMIATRKYQAEQSAGRPLYPAFGTAVPDPRPLTSPDVMNVANISVLPHHGRLYALWEAGSPWEMDPESLTTRGIHEFSAETAGLPFSAHPRVEPDGTLWNFGYLSSAGKLVFWHVAASGALKRAGVIDCDPMSAPHDFVVTKNHLVLFLPPFYFEPEGAPTFLDAHRWYPDRPTRVLVVDKNDFDSHQTFELPAQWVFHFGNAWEDDAGVIRLDAARAPDPTEMTTTFRKVMRGEDSPRQGSIHHAYRIDLKRRTISETPMTSHTVNSEFPVVDPRVIGRRYSQLIMMTSSRSAPHPMLNEVTKLDTSSGRMDTFRYPDTCIPEEHLYVPDRSKDVEQGGWVIGSALDYQNERMELRVFDAERLSDGPLATARLPYAMPLGLHGKFV